MTSRERGGTSSPPNPRTPRWVKEGSECQNTGSEEVTTLKTTTQQCRRKKQIRHRPAGLLKRIVPFVWCIGYSLMASPTCSSSQECLFLYSCYDTKDIRAVLLLFART